MSDETSPRYHGWRVVAVCFATAVFSWSFGFYGQGVYLAELQRLTGWPVTVISTASTAYYLLSAVLVVYVGEGIARLGPQRFLLGGMACLGVSTATIGWVNAPWQLYLGYLLMSFGWAAMGVAALSTIIGLWFNERRGLALSLALNGASIGGVVGAPALVMAVDRFGFATALSLGVAIMALLLVPMTLAWIRDVPNSGGGHAPSKDVRRASSAKQHVALTRTRALLNLPFWTVTAPFALALLSQVGILVHQIAFLEPALGRSLSGLAVSVTAIAAVVGRLGLGVIIDRLNKRLVSAVSFLSQAAALYVIARADHPAILLAACGVFGLSVGNVITLPALIIQDEFDSGAFAMLIGLSTAIGQFIYAFGPALVGFLRDASGGYGLAILACAALELVAAGIVLVPAHPWR